MAIGDKRTTQRTIARKLHNQFAHPRAETLINLIKKAGFKDKKLQKQINEVSKNCIICLKHKKTTPRPVVCLPLASRFNEMIGIDLKKWNDNYFLVIVDIATRFCQAYVIPNKLPSTIIRALFVSWISIFGAPQKILSDNGGEFSNAEMRELSDIFFVKLFTTAAESPWSNGICERLNSTLGDIVSKIMEDTGCNVHIALSWAVAARNAFDNKSGVSPNQLVFGFNPSFPTIYDSKLPASSFEDPSTDIIKRNCDARNKAREIFIKYEANERIRKALRHNVRHTDIDTLQQGDEVLYKRKDNNKWQGPAKVAHINLAAKTVTVNHGGYLIKAHAVSIMKIPPLDIEPQDDAEDIDEILSEKQPENDIPTSNNESSKQDNVSPNLKKATSEKTLPPETQKPKGNSSIGDGTKNNKNTKGENSKSDIKKIVNMKEGQRFQGIDIDTGKHITGRIINRAGKVKGSNKHCFNIERDDGWRGWINMENIQDLQMIADNFPLIILFSSAEVSKAKEREVRKWIENNVFNEVEDKGQPIITVRWVITEKLVDNEVITNARLVARGFEEDTARLKKDSPTCSRESVHIVIFFARCHGWKCHSVDVKAAYLQGDKITRDVYLQPPEEFNNGNLWKLKKNVYGLADAARNWYLRVKKELINLGVEQCSLDKAIFFWYKDGQLEGIICLYVDNFLFAGSHCFLNSIIKSFMKIFNVGSTGSDNFTYVGLRLNTYKDGITLDQEHYIASIKEVDLSKKRKLEKTDKLTKRELAAFRTLVGQLSWISTHSRPDIAFEVCVLGTGFQNATVSDVLSLNNLARRIQTSNVNLYFPNMESANEYNIVCYTDASFRSLPMEGSQAGFIIFIQTSEEKKCPIFWQSKKIERVVDSSLAAEAEALHEGMKASYYMYNVLKMIKPNLKLKIICKTDSKSLVTALESTNQVQNRWLRLHLLGINEMLENKLIERLLFVKSEDQLADCLTKKGKCRDGLIYSICRN